jgi:hypothetical protein
MDLFGPSSRFDKQIKYNRFNQLHDIGRVGAQKSDRTAKCRILSVLPRRAISRSHFLHTHKTTHTLLSNEYCIPVRVALDLERDRFLVAAR